MLLGKIIVGQCFSVAAALQRTAAAGPAAYTAQGYVTTSPASSQTLPWPRLSSPLPPFLLLASTVSMHLFLVPHAATYCTAYMCFVSIAVAPHHLDANFQDLAMHNVYLPLTHLLLREHAPSLIRRAWMPAAIIVTNTCSML